MDCLGRAALLVHEHDDNRATAGGKMEAFLVDTLRLTDPAQLKSKARRDDRDAAVHFFPRFRDEI